MNPSTNNPTVAKAFLSTRHADGQKAWPANKPGIALSANAKAETYVNPETGDAVVKVWHGERQAWVPDVMLCIPRGGSAVIEAVDA